MYFQYYGVPSKKAFVSSLTFVHNLYSANRLRYLILFSLVTSTFCPLGIRGIIYKKTGCINVFVYTIITFGSDVVLVYSSSTNI